MKLISPLVEESCVVVLFGSTRSTSIALASALPSSTPHWSNEFTSQMTPCVKILCSYIAISAPSTNGVTFFTRIELVGRLPVNTLCGSRFSSASPARPAFSSSARACSAVLPIIRASVCARKLASRIVCIAPSSTGLCVWTGAMKSHGMRRVPCELVECMLAVSARLAPDDRPGGKVDALARLRHALAVALHVALLEVGGKPVQILVVREQGVRLRSVEVRVPDAHQRKDDRSLRDRGRLYILVERRRHEWAPSSSFSKLSKPMASEIERPIADQSE
uniref:Uncharacterized protein n=1 Tax=Anopheles atroparvus TaxID=41427 RepID=A0A182IS09_ANOAO